MIKCDKGDLELNGTMMDLMAETSLVINGVMKSFEKIMPHEFAEELVMACVKTGLTYEGDVDTSTSVDLSKLKSVLKELDND